MGGTENSEELITLPADATKNAELLKNQSPGDQGKEQQNAKDGARNIASLLENLEDIANKKCGYKRSNVSSPQY